MIWPGKKPDLLISVGTGYTADGRPHQDSPGEILRDRAVIQLIRAVTSSPSMDGEQAFLEALGYVSDRMRDGIYRVNQQRLDEPFPWLDDVGKLAELAESSASLTTSFRRS